MALWKIKYDFRLSFFLKTEIVLMQLCIIHVRVKVLYMGMYIII